MDKNQSSTYSQILKSSAIVGGAQGINIIIRTLRIKIVAILLGPNGVGLIGLFQSTIEFVGKLTRFGIGSSAVRQIAEAQSSQNFERLGRVVKTLGRVSIVTAILGWLMAIVLAKPLSIWTFGNSERALAFAILGSAIFITTFYENQTALLQGSRRISDLAKVMVFSSLIGTVVSISLYAWLGERGIIIALPTAAAVNLAFSWWFALKVDAPKVDLNWREITSEAMPMVTLGLAFMWAGILNTGVAFMTRSLIIRNLGVDASGIYQAAWAISGLFAGFILTAMGKDFYPRLTAVSENNDMVNQLVNEQIEVGVLIALPGLLATIAFSPWVIHIFYTAKFLQASELLCWFVLGVFGRVVSWPMGFIQLAKGASLTFSLTETFTNLSHLIFIWLGLRYMGLIGVAIAFVLLYLIYTCLIYCVSKRLSGFKLTRSVVFLTCCSILFIAIELTIIKMIKGLPATLASIVLVAISGSYCLKQLTTRLGPHHRISILCSKIPGLKCS